MKVVRKSLATQIKPQSGRKERSGLQKLAKVEKGKYNEVDAYVHCSEFLFYYFFVSFFFLFIFFIFFYVFSLWLLYGAFHFAFASVENLYRPNGYLQDTCACCFSGFEMQTECGQVKRRRQ